MTSIRRPINWSRRLLLLAIVGGVVAAGCGGGSSTPKERPLTFEEATVMAELLYGNYTDKGAAFVANTVVVSGGAQLTLTGEIDWVTHQGVATVTTSAPNATLAAVMWGESVVLERRPALDQVLAGLGYPKQPVIARAPNTNLRLDQLIAIIVGLAAEQRDNAQLIAQTEGSAFIRDDVLRGRNVKVMRYGTRNLYWVDAETGKLLRLEATSANAGLPTVIDILERKPVTITPPDQANVITASDIKDVYQTVGPL